MTDVSQLSNDELFAALPASPDTFAQRFGAQAAQAGQKLGVDPSIILAQWGHETGWGKSIIPGTNNLGNIKGAGPRAVDNATGSNDSYAAYKTPDDFVSAYTDLVQRKYPGAVGAGSNVGKFTGGLQGYAEDPSYPARIAAAQKTVRGSPGLIEQAMNAIVPSAKAAEPVDMTKMSNEDLAQAAGVDLSAVPEEQLRAAAGVPAPAAPAAPQPGIWDQLTHQLGRTANAAGHGIANAVGVVGDPISLALNKLTGQNNPHIGKALGDLVDQYTPAPANDMEKTVGDIGAQVANPLTYLAGGGGVARAALGGALGAGAQPIQPGQTIGDYAGQVAAGAAGGGALGVVGKALKGVTLSKEAQLLKDAGVTLTPGQVLGETAKKIEDKATSIPILGDAIASAQRGSINDFNKALYKDVLAPIGGKPPTTVGRDAIDAISQKLSDKYDEILPKLTFQADSQFMKDIQPIAQTVNSLPPDMQRRFGEVVDRNFFSQLKNGQMDGQTMKKVESVLGQEASKYRSSPDPFHRDMGQAIGDVQTSMRQALVRSNPAQAQDLQALNGAYARFSTLRNAGARVNDPGKPIMPGQYQAAVKAADKTVAKGNFAKGKARGQDMSDAAMNVLGQKYPDSGTAGRGLLAGGLAGGAGYLSPPTALGGLGLTALYGTQRGRAAMLAMLAQRPDLVRAAGGSIQNAGPIAGAVAQGLLQGER